MRKIELHDIKNLADNIVHCGDYGRTYIKNDLSEVWVVLGDADDVELDKLEFCVGCSGLKFTVEAEYGPDEDEYTLISEGIEAENYDYEDNEESLKSGYVIPKPLSIGEYAEYLQLFYKLEK